MRLAGQVAIVTGSSRGVGRPVALAMAREDDEEILREKRGIVDSSGYSVVPGCKPPPVCREMVE